MMGLAEAQWEFTQAPRPCPGGGMVDTPVLEAGAERRESSSLSWGTKSKSLFLREEKQVFFFWGAIV